MRPLALNFPPFEPCLRKYSRASFGIFAIDLKRNRVQHILKGVCILKTTHRPLGMMPHHFTGEFEHITRGDTHGASPISPSPPRNLPHDNSLRHLPEPHPKPSTSIPRLHARGGRFVIKAVNCITRPNALLVKFTGARAPGGPSQHCTL